MSRIPSQFRAVALSSVALLCGMAVGTGGAAAQDASSREEIASLKRTLCNHEQRIALLERLIREGIDSDATADSASQPGWESIRVGMSEATVVSILGRPDQVQSRLSMRTLSYGSGPEQGLHMGSITIDQDDDMVVSIVHPSPPIGR